MPTVLQEVELKPEIEYKVEKYGNVYFAGVRKAHFNPCAGVNGDLFLDRFEGREQVKLWKPKIYNPFYKEKLTRDRREPEFLIDDMMITWERFDNFMSDVNEKLLYKYGRKISADDFRAFFSQAYEYYKGIANSAKNQG